jgi:hypothetical protein
VVLIMSDSVIVSHGLNFIFVDGQVGDERGLANPRWTTFFPAARGICPSYDALAGRLSSDESSRKNEMAPRFKNIST